VKFWILQRLHVDLNGCIISGLKLQELKTLQKARNQ